MQPEPQKSHVATQWAYDAPLINCRFDPQGRYVFATAQDRKVVRWELASGNRVALAGHDSWAGGIALSPAGDVLVTGGYDDTLIWWPVDGEKPEPIRHVKAHQGWIRTVQVSPDGKLLASGGNDKIVRLWNLGDGTLVREMAGHELDIYSSLFTLSGEFLLTGDLLGKVHQWETGSGKLVRSFEAPELHSYNGGQQVHYGGIRGLAISPDGKHLVCAGLYKASNPLGAVNEPLVVRFEWESQKIIHNHIAEGVQGIAWRALFHPNGTLIGCSGGSGGGFLVFWNAEQDKDFHRLQLPNTAVECDLHPDGLQIATVHHDKHLRISKMQAA